MKVSVVIPCLNECQTLEKTVGLARGLLESVGGDGEIVISDNGSTDGSPAIAEKAGARVIHIERKGYGYALLGGIREAKGDIIVMGDADATYDFREAKALVEAIERGCDLAMGSRLRGKIEKGAMPFLHRHLGTPVLSLLIRFFFGLRISDCNCGMRAFSKEAFEKLHMVSGGMEFASEMLIKAAVVGLRVEETPISLARDMRNRHPHLNTWRDGWRHLRFILLMAPHVVFQIPGVVLAAVFGLQTILLALGPLKLGRSTLDYHHLFYSVPFFCVGVQLLWFNAFATHFRRFSGLEIHGGHPDESPHFPLERWLVIGSLLVLLGMGLFCFVLVQWWRSGFAGLFAIRPCAFALASVITGITSITNALFTSMLELSFRSK